MYICKYVYMFIRVLFGEVRWQEAPPASMASPAASAAKPQAEGTVGPETAEVVPVQERMWMRSNRT